MSHTEDSTLGQNGAGCSGKGSADGDSTRVYALTKENVVCIVIDTIRNTVGIGPALEEQILKAVKEEVALALKRVSPPHNGEFVVNGIQQSEPRNLELKFLDKLSQPVLTGKNIQGEDGSSCLKIALVEVGTGKIVDCGPEASAMVDLMAILAHPGPPESRPDSKPSLNGTTIIKMKKGIGLLENVWFAHKSIWRKTCQLMLGAHVVGNFEGVTIKEALSEKFILRDSRLPLYKKHHSPSLSDKTWRLNNITKGGALQRSLSENNIETVEDFLKEYHINPQRLREIVGPYMSSQKLNDTVRHGLKCRIEERFIYRLPDSSQTKPFGVVFNSVGQVLGVQYEHGNINPVQGLSEAEKITAQNLVVSAFSHWDNVVCCPNDVKEPNSPAALINCAQPSTSSPSIDSFSGLSNYDTSGDDLGYNDDGRFLDSSTKGLGDSGYTVDTTIRPLYDDFTTDSEVLDWLHRQMFDIPKEHDGSDRDVQSSTRSSPAL